MNIKTLAKKVLPAPIVRRLGRERHKETHINRAITSVNGEVYVEIGVRDAACFRQIKVPRKIGIDPDPISSNYKLGMGESFFQMTSDAFFANQADLVLGGQRIDVALVDGLHEFSQALRDVLHLERLMAPNGFIFIHDCNPARREHAELRQGAWNGDVWKVAYYLRTYRNDLSFFTLNHDFGVGVLSSFKSPAAANAPSAEILEHCQLLDYGILERNRQQILDLRSASYCRRFIREQARH
jgi:hypothetical protein